MSSYKLAFRAILGLFIAVPASATDVLWGPSDYAIDGFTPSLSIPGVESVGTIDSIDLNGTESVLIDFTVANVSANDGWLTLIVNGDETFGSFDSVDTVGAFLTRVTTTTETEHNIYASGDAPEGATATAAAFSDSDGLSHAVRITLSGFDDGNGFTGVRTVTFEVDEFSTVFVSADATMTWNLDFGDTDNGLSLHFQAAGQNKTINVSNFTIARISEPGTHVRIPEPGTYALIGGLVALGAAMGRRRL